MWKNNMNQKSKNNRNAKKFVIANDWVLKWYYLKIKKLENDTTTTDVEFSKMTHDKMSEWYLIYRMIFNSSDKHFNIWQTSNAI